MQDPRAWVVRCKADRNIITRSSEINHITADRIVIVVALAPSHTDYAERVSVEMHGVLEMVQSSVYISEAMGITHSDTGSRRD